MEMGHMASFRQLAAQGAKEAEQRGFEPTTWDNFPAKLVLIIDELTEAALTTADALFGEELADVALRTLEALHNVWGAAWDDSRMMSAAETGSAERVRCAEPIEVHLWPIVGHVCKAVRAWSRDDRKDAMICLELAVVHTIRVSKRFGRRLDVDMVSKLVKNRGRPFRHGRPKGIG